jgi:hypothetical protein
MRGSAALVSFDLNVVQEYQIAGIALWDSSAAEPRILAGLRYDASGWESGLSAVQENTNEWDAFIVPTTTAYFRIERIAGASPTGKAQFRAAYRTELSDNWIYYRTVLNEDSLSGGSFPTAHQQLAFLTEDWGGHASAGLFDNARVYPRNCSQLGGVRLVPAGQQPLSAQIQGLAPGTSNTFAVASVSASGGEGAWSTVTAIAVQPSATPAPALPLTGDIALNQPTVMSGIDTNAGGSPIVPTANLGVDGVIDQVSGAARASDARSRWAHRACTVRGARGSWPHLIGSRFTRCR